jgi:mRNA interferase RelE/StbE
MLKNRIGKKLKYFSDMSDPLSYAEPLKNFTGGGSYRFRIGDYRVIFDVIDDTIAVLYIEHRRDVYRRK